MNDKQASQVVKNIFNQVFNKEIKYTLEQIREKFAFDVKLPVEVKDSVTGESTWTEMPNSKKFITNNNMEKYDSTRGWMIQKRKIENLSDIIKAWEKINFTTTERVYDSINVSKSDTIYSCTNIYQSTDCRSSKNIIFSDGIGSSENVIASQRSSNLANCIRVDDSGTCSNSYNVICSAKITNSIFIQDCNNLYECMFCSHIASKRYCIANMQFEKNEYLKIKEVIINWILENNY